MTKENFVLIHSYPTNSILLSGLIEYLNDFFNVYFIDLPGFTRAVPPLDKVDFQSYARFVGQKLTDWNLDHYVIAGISFGFAVVNTVKLDQRCRAIMAVEPFVGIGSLRMSAREKTVLRLLLRGVIGLGLCDVVWKSQLMRSFMKKYPAWTVEIVLREIDAKTFFKTGLMLLNDTREYVLQDYPYVLVANKADNTVNYDYLYGVISRQAKRLLVLNTNLDHYPEDLSKAAFRQQIPESYIGQMLEFLDH